MCNALYALSTADKNMLSTERQRSTRGEHWAPVRLTEHWALVAVRCAVRAAENSRSKAICLDRLFWRDRADLYKQLDLCDFVFSAFILFRNGRKDIFDCIKIGLNGIEKALLQSVWYKIVRMQPRIEHLIYWKTQKAKWANQSTKRDTHSIGRILQTITRSYYFCLLYTSDAADD